MREISDLKTRLSSQTCCDSFNFYLSVQLCICVFFTSTSVTDGQILIKLGRGAGSLVRWIVFGYKTDNYVLLRDEKQFKRNRNTLYLDMP